MFALKSPFPAGLGVIANVAFVKPSYVKNKIKYLQCPLFQAHTFFFSFLYPWKNLLTKVHWIMFTYIMSEFATSLSLDSVGNVPHISWFHCNNKAVDGSSKSYSLPYHVADSMSCLSLPFFLSVFSIESIVSLVAQALNSKMIFIACFFKKTSL